MKASPKITPHELIESSQDLSNNTVIQGEKLKLKNPLNSTSFSEETDRSNPDLAVVYKELCQFVVFSEDRKLADDADRLFENAIASASNWLSTVSGPSSNESLD